MILPKKNKQTTLKMNSFSEIYQRTEITGQTAAPKTETIEIQRITAHWEQNPRARSPQLEPISMGTL